MFKYILVFLCAMIAGCGNLSNSLLANKSVSFQNGIAGSPFTGTFYLDASGTFTANESYPKSCALDGTWDDSNPGDKQGTLTLNVKNDGCNASENGQSIKANYVISGGTVVFN